MRASQNPWIHQIILIMTTNQQKQLNIVQWNADGFYRHYPEFKLLENKYNSFVYCIQETKFPFNHHPQFKNYKTFYKNVNSDTVAHGGVAILINDIFDAEEINLKTNLQAVAVRIYYPKKIII